MGNEPVLSAQPAYKSQPVVVAGGDQLQRIGPSVVIPPRESERPLQSLDRTGHDRDPRSDQRPPIEKTDVKDGGFVKAVKDNWKEFGIGAPFKAVSDVLVKDPYQPMSKAGIIGWIKVLASLPMEVVASILGFFSGMAINTGPEIKDLFSKGNKNPEIQGMSTLSPDGSKQELSLQEDRVDVSGPERQGLKNDHSVKAPETDPFHNESVREAARRANMPQS